MAVRPERVPAEEVRQRMLDAGRALALEAGAALTIEHLRLEEVIQRARVPRSSVYRMWPYREDYIDDLLSYLAGAGSWFSDRTVLDPDTRALASTILADNRHLLATPDGRRALMRELVRVVTTRNYESLTSSAPWRLHMALATTLGSTRTGEARKRIAAALEDSQRRSRESIVDLFGYLSDAIGYRLRDPGWTVSHMQLAGGLFVQSMALRNLQVQVALGTEAEPGTTAAAQDPDHDPAAAHRPAAAKDGDHDQAADAALVDRLLNAGLPGPGLNGETARWTLAAFAYLGIVEAFIELDPDFVPPAG